MIAVRDKSLTTNSPVDGGEKSRMRISFAENASQYRVSNELLMVTPPACGTRVPVFLLVNIGISTLGPLACARIVLMPSRL